MISGRLNDLGSNPGRTTNIEREKMSNKAELKDDLNKHTLTYVKHTVEEIKRLRHWFAGFQAAGGTLPACEKSFSALHKAHTLLDDYASLMEKYGKIE